MNTRRRKMRGSAKFLVPVHTSLMTKAGGHGLNWYELLSISVSVVLEMRGSLTQVGVSAVDVSLTQLTPFRSRTFTPIEFEIISFSKTFCVATWFHYTPFAPCGHRKSLALKKNIYIFRAYLKAALSNLGSFLSKNVVLWGFTLGSHDFNLTCLSTETLRSRESSKHF